MKPIKTSFLFFLIVFFTINICVFAQSNIDSLKYYSDLALKPQKANDLNRAYDYFDTNYKLLLDKGDIYAAINSLYYKSSVLYKNGDYINSETTIVKAIEHLDNINENPYTIKVKLSFYNLLGLLYTEQKNKSKAIELYNNALTRAKRTLDSITLYNNISLVYKNFNDYENAKKEIVKAYKLIPRTSDTLIKALVLDNYGVIESEFDKTKGLSLMNEALELRAFIKDTSTIYTSYNHLAKYYHRVENKLLAKEYGIKALEIAKKINSPSYLENALGQLAEISDDPYAQEYKRLIDSLDFSKAIEENKFAFMEYEYSEYKRKAVESELEKQREQNMKLLYLIIVIIITLSSVFIHYMQKSKHKKEKLKQVFDTESRISKKVHDDIANDVFQVMTAIQTDNEVNQTIKDDIENIYDKARDISKQLGEIDLEGDYKTILNDLALRYNTVDTNIIIKDISRISWNKISKTKKTALYKVIQELFINMKKHSEASIAVVAFNSEQKRITINYSDDGIGCELKKSNGLLNMENRIKTVGGNITFKSEINNGFKAKIEI